MLLLRFGLRGLHVTVRIGFLPRTDAELLWRGLRLRLGVGLRSGRCRVRLALALHALTNSWVHIVDRIIFAFLFGCDLVVEILHFTVTLAVALTDEFLLLFAVLRHVAPRGCDSRIQRIMIFLEGLVRVFAVLLAVGGSDGN